MGRCFTSFVWQPCWLTLWVTIEQSVPSLPCVLGSYGHLGECISRDITAPAGNPWAWFLGTTPVGGSSTGCWGSTSRCGGRGRRRLWGLEIKQVISTTTSGPLLAIYRVYLVNKLWGNFHINSIFFSSFSFQKHWAIAWTNKMFHQRCFYPGRISDKTFIL